MRICQYYILFAFFPPCVCFSSFQAFGVSNVITPPSVSVVVFYGVCEPESNKTHMYGQTYIFLLQIYYSIIHINYTHSSITCILVHNALKFSALLGIVLNKW